MVIFLFSTEFKPNTDYNISGVELAFDLQDGVSSSAYQTNLVANNRNAVFVPGPAVDWSGTPRFRVTTTRGKDNHYQLDYPSYDGGLTTFRCYPERLLCCDSYESLEQKAESLYIDNVSCTACKLFTNRPFVVSC